MSNENKSIDQIIGESEVYLLTKHPCSWCNKIVNLKQAFDEGTAYFSFIIALEDDEKVSYLNTYCSEDCMTNWITKYVGSMDVVEGLVYHKKGCLHMISDYGLIEKLKEFNRKIDEKSKGDIV
jgi:hypothetical protein